MSYAIYKTEAFILRKIPAGEAHVDVVFFTRELGKITARVTSGRMIHSKMRMHLTRHRLVTIDIVRGKNIWRLTGITTESRQTFLTDAFRTPWSQGLLLLEELIQGEESHQDLFDDLKKFYQHTQVEDKATGFEIALVVTVLGHLGYWYENFSHLLNNDSLSRIDIMKKEYIKKINESIKATQIVV